MRRCLAGVIGLAGILLITGCGETDGTASSADRSPSSSPTASATGEAPTPTPRQTLSEREIEKVLAGALLTDDEAADLGIVADADYGPKAFGLSTPTSDYCSDDTSQVKSESMRAARAQMWWNNQQWSSGDAGRLSIGTEVLLFKPGGVTTYLDELSALPSDCPRAEFEDTAELWSDTTLPGMPEGAVVVGRETLSTGSDQSTPGFVIAIPAGDVLGILHLRGDDEKPLEGMSADLAASYAKRLDQVQRQLS